MPLSRTASCSHFYIVSGQICLSRGEPLISVEQYPAGEGNKEGRPRATPSLREQQLSLFSYDLHLMFTNGTHVVLYHAVISVACAKILRNGIHVFVHFTTTVRREWTQHFHRKSEGKARDDKLILSSVVVGT